MPSKYFPVSVKLSHSHSPSRSRRETEHGSAAPPSATGGRTVVCYGKATLKATVTCTASSPTLPALPSSPQLASCLRLHMMYEQLSSPAPQLHTSICLYVCPTARHLCSPSLCVCVWNKSREFIKYCQVYASSPATSVDVARCLCGTLLICK